MGTSSNNTPSPLGYMGIVPTQNPGFISVPRSPTVNDWQNYPIGFEWQDTSVYPPIVYKLLSVQGAYALWEQITGVVQSAVETIDGILPDPSGNFSITAASSNITIAPIANGISIDSAGGSSGVLTINHAFPIAGDFEINGTGNVSVTAANPAVVSLTGIVPISQGGTGLGSTPTDGQLLIGDGMGYTLATLTEGAGISIINTAGAISITATGAPSSAIQTINTISPVSNNFTITAGSGISITSGTGSVTVASPLGMVLLQTVAPTGGVLDFILSTYEIINFNQFRILITSVFPTSNGDSIYMLISNDHGATFISSGYNGSLNYNDPSTATQTNVMANGNFLLAHDVHSSGGGFGLYANLDFSIYYNVPHFTGTSCYVASSGLLYRAQLFGQGYGLSPNADAFRITCASGLQSFSSASIYGIFQ